MSGYPGGGYPGNQDQYPGRLPNQTGYPPNTTPTGENPGTQRTSYPVQVGYGQKLKMDPNVVQWFNAVDTDRSGQITAQQLQRALVNGNMSHFSEKACRMMIEMFDMKRSGTINITEFSELSKYITFYNGKIW